MKPVGSFCPRIPPRMPVNLWGTTVEILGGMVYSMKDIKKQIAGGPGT